MIAGIDKRGPAGRAGLLTGDIVVQLADLAVDSPEGFMIALERLRPGTAVRLRVLRAGQTIELSVTTAEVTTGPRATRREGASRE